MKEKTLEEIMNGQFKIDSPYKYVTIDSFGRIEIWTVKPIYRKREWVFRSDASLNADVMDLGQIKTDDNEEVTITEWRKAIWKIKDI